MRIMGIDYGDSRIGIAVSDPFGWTAQAVETICFRGDLDRAVLRIEQIIEDYGVEKIVVGFPVNMNGTVGFRGEKTLEFIRFLSERVNKEVIKWDERLTTAAANRTLREAGIKTSKKKAVVDTMAATYILQGYLDSINSK